MAFLPIVVSFRIICIQYRYWKEDKSWGIYSRLERDAWHTPVQILGALIDAYASKVVYSKTDYIGVHLMMENGISKVKQKHYYSFKVNGGRGQLTKLF